MVDYFAGIKWAEPLPKVVQAAIVESLENTGKIKAAGTESSGIMPSHVIRLEIRDFQADYGSGEAPTINIKIIGRLLQPGNHSLLKQFTITAEAEAKSNSRTHIMEAFEQAFIAAQDDLLTKTLGK
jgi:cholesterol transport system auxiliary component